jgi:hypothetical protein
MQGTWVPALALLGRDTPILRLLKLVARIERSEIREQPSNLNRRSRMSLTLHPGYSRNVSYRPSVFAMISSQRLPSSA